MTRTIQAIKFGDDTVYIEVSDVEQQGGNNNGDTREDVNALTDISNAGQQLYSTVRAVVGTVKTALDEAKPKELTIEINMGFKGKAGIPFITEGEANGAVKVTAKWIQ